MQRSLVESHLKKVLESAEFARSERMARFLRFVVQHSLDALPGANPTGFKERSGFKERTIGIAVYDRPPDWDPKVDTIVRSEARRLRTKLDLYYATSGIAEPIRITIPKGGYAPEFAVVGESALPPPPVPPYHPPYRLPWRPAAAFSAAFAILTVVFWLYARDREISKARADTFETAPFATELGIEVNPAIAPDGKTVAYVWDGNGSNYDIYLKGMDAKGTGEFPRVRFTADPLPDVYPSWSPDGGALAFLRVGQDRTQVVLKPVAGGTERIITQIATRRSGWTGDYSPSADLGPSWTRDGKSLVLSDTGSAHNGQELFLLNIATGARRQLTSTEREICDFLPRVSPDGRQLAFARYYSHGVSDLFVMNLEDRQPRQLTFDRRTIAGLAWTPDGHSLVYSSLRQGAARLWRIGVDGGAARRILSDASSAADISISASGDALAYASISENWNIWRAALHESAQGSVMGTPERFLSSSGRNHGPKYSPDGKTLAFMSDRSGAWEIWLASPDGLHPRQLTHFNGPFLGCITWTPDSRTIAFDARPSGNSNIFLMNIEGGEPTPLAANRFEERMPSFSRDGKAIYFNSDRDGSVAVWRTELNGGQAVKVGQVTSFASGQSWDGKALYYNLQAGSLWRAEPDGSRAVQLAGVEAAPEINWAAGPHGFYYTRLEGLAGSQFYQFVNGAPRLLAHVPGQLVLSTANLTVSPGGDWLLYAQRDHFTSDITLRRGSLGK